MTPEELEDFHHSPCDEEIPTLTTNIHNFLLPCDFRPTPQEEDREEFEQRPPALGATQDILDEISSHYQLLPPVQQRSLYSHLRSIMLRNLISCDGVATLDELVDILQQELDSGIPAPVPDWYEYSTVKWGPRKIGYDGCNNRGCKRTESTSKKFSRCSGCKVAMYCSRDCQVEDWKIRHKKVCKDAKKERENIIKTCGFMSMFAS